MNTQSTIHIGVDVSKLFLDLSDFDNGEARIPNTPKGIGKLIKRIRAMDDEVIVTCEATGGYERLLVEELCVAKIPTSRVNPAQVRYYAKSQGILAKTDSIDAWIISLFARSRFNTKSLYISSAGEPALEELRGLLQLRQTLRNDILANKNRLDPMPVKCVAKFLRGTIKHLEEQLKKVEAALDNWLEQQAEYKADFERLFQVKGFGRISILSLFAYIPELGNVSDKRASALIGAAPYVKQSGSQKGSIGISGGRRHVRNVIYMAALSATRFNPILSEFYERLLANGKPRKVARIAVVRKMVVLANRILANPDFKIAGSEPSENLSLAC